MAALAQEAPLNGVGRDEDVSWLGVKMIFGGAQEAEALFGDFQVTGAVIGAGALLLSLLVAVLILICVSPKVFQNESLKTT